MPKEYFVIRAGRVVYSPGHYDLDGALKVKDTTLFLHPKATVTIVKIESVWQAPKQKSPLQP